MFTVQKFMLFIFQQIFKICKEKVIAPDPIGSSSIQYFPDNVYNSKSVFTCQHYYDEILHWISVLISTEVQCKKAEKSLTIHLAFQIHHACLCSVIYCLFHTSFRLNSTLALNFKKYLNKNQFTSRSKKSSVQNFRYRYLRSNKQSALRSNQAR